MKKSTDSFIDSKQKINLFDTKGSWTQYKFQNSVNSETIKNFDEGKRLSDDEIAFLKFSMKMG